MPQKSESCVPECIALHRGKLASITLDAPMPRPPWMAVALAAIKVAEAAEAERPKYTRRSNGSWIHTKGKPWYGKFQRRQVLKHRWADRLATA